MISKGKTVRQLTDADLGYLAGIAVARRLQLVKVA